MKSSKYLQFLWDVFICALGSYGGPEAHYGVFSKVLVDKKKYLSEEELGELIGLYSLVPGPGSTQTITAIGYLVGGPLLAILTFIVWALPAIVIMTGFGVFFSILGKDNSWLAIVRFLPAAAIAFIIYAAVNMTKKVVKKSDDWILYLAMVLLSFILTRYSPLFVPILLLLGGSIYYLSENSSNTLETKKLNLKPKWSILFVVFALAVFNEVLNLWIINPYLNLYTSFYKYGYSVIGGGQVLIPLMIEDLVNAQSIISRNDFLSGYAIDQAVPGPLFSFAAFVGARSMGDAVFPGFMAGVLSGLSIFLPGILLVFFIFPLWKKSREVAWIKLFLKGVSITAAALISMTVIKQLLILPVDWLNYAVLILSSLILLSRKMPAALVILLALILGYIKNFV